MNSTITSLTYPKLILDQFEDCFFIVVASIEALNVHNSNEMVSWLLGGTHTLALMTMSRVCIMLFRPTSDVPTHNHSGAINTIQLVLDSDRQA
jgi:hypothetical protein